MVLILSSLCQNMQYGVGISCFELPLVTQQSVFLTQCPSESISGIIYLQMSLQYNRLAINWEHAHTTVFGIKRIIIVLQSCLKHGLMTVGMA